MQQAAQSNNATGGAEEYNPFADTNKPAAAQVNKIKFLFFFFTKFDLQKEIFT